MTANLYDRIDAIERFAADVAHELKNPLTSLASAMEMFARAKDDETRARLLTIVRGDIKRIDRLITDISDASRLDAELSREAKEPDRAVASADDHHRNLPDDRQSPRRGSMCWTTICRPARSCAAATKGWARCSAT